jgi:hypothetical protein
MYQIYQYILFIGLVLTGIGVVVLSSLFPRGNKPARPVSSGLAEAALGFALAALGVFSAIVGWVGLT